MQYGAPDTLDELLHRIRSIKSQCGLPVAKNKDARFDAVNGQALGNIALSMSTLQNLFETPTAIELRAPVEEPIEEPVEKKIKEFDILSSAPLSIDSDDNGFDPRRISSFSVATEMCKTHHLLIGAEGSSAAIAFKLLRSQVHQQMLEAKYSILGITSPCPGDGKTTVSVNLAFMLSLSANSPVILVDLDLYKGSVAKKCGLQPEYSIADWVEGRATLEQVLYQVEGTNLYVIPAVAQAAKSSGILNVQGIDDLLSAVREVFPDSLVIADLPPVLAVDDALLVDEIDTFLMVLAESQTTKDESLQAIEMLKGQSMLGFVLNKSKKSPTSKSYKSYYYDYAASK